MPVTIPPQLIAVTVTDVGNGADATVSVTGTAGREWAVLRSDRRHTPGQLLWTSVLTGFGDSGGTVTQAPGFYHWQAISANFLSVPIVDISPIYYQPIASLTECIHAQILRAVVSGLQSINMTGIGNRVFLQTYPRYNKDIEGLNASDEVAMVGVAPYPNETPDARHNTNDTTQYPVCLAFFDKAGYDDVSRLARFLLWRRQAAAYFRYQRPAGVRGVYYTDWQPSGIIAAEAVKSGYLVGTMVFNFKARETRGLVTN